MMKPVTTYPRARPVIELAGTPFYVDAQWLYLVEVGNPDNKIDIQETRAAKDHIELWYDSSTKNIYRGSQKDLPDVNHHIFYFHSLSALDPVGATALLDELNPDWRADFNLDLPIVNLAGRQFFVDEKYRSFYEVNNWWNSISFDKILSRNKVKGLYINVNNHNVAFPEELRLAFALSSWPGHIVFVPVPKWKKGNKKVKQHSRRKKRQ